MRQSIRSRRGVKDLMAPAYPVSKCRSRWRDPQPGEEEEEETAEQTAGLKKIEGGHGYCMHRAACSELRLAPRVDSSTVVMA